MTQHPVGKSRSTTAPSAALKAAPSETTVTVMSFNIHHGQGTDGVVDLKRTARVIRASGADIAGLQEVDRNFAERSNWTDQAAELARLLTVTGTSRTALTSTSIRLRQGDRVSSSAMPSCRVTR